MADSVLRCLDSVLSTHPDEAPTTLQGPGSRLRRWEKVKEAWRGLAK